jgi:hypothetical protein
MFHKYIDIAASRTVSHFMLPGHTMSQFRGNGQLHSFRLPAELCNVTHEGILGDLSNEFACFGGLTYVLKDIKGLHVWFVNRQMYQETRLLPYS